MGFYFKLAPGVRIRATSRGLRASVGPRPARVHFGACGPGVSTGAGPVTLYRSLSRGRPAARRASGPSRTAMAAHERELRQSQKQEDAREVADVFSHILDLHQGDFTAAAPPTAPEPAPVDETRIRTLYEQEALQGISPLRLSARADARREASIAADREIAAETARRRQQYAALQAHLDEQWNRLRANDPDVLIATLSEAFEDNEAPAAVAGVRDSEVCVVVLAPAEDTVPARMPEISAAGNLTFRRLPKAEQNDYYALLVCGHVLATVRETLALAPAIETVRVAVIRATAPNAYGVRSTECLLATVLSRRSLCGIQWETANSAAIMSDASSELLINQGTAGALKPIDLSDEPGLAALVQGIDLEDFGVRPR